MPSGVCHGRRGASQVHAIGLDAILELGVARIIARFINAIAARDPHEMRVVGRIGEAGDDGFDARIEASGDDGEPPALTAARYGEAPRINIRARQQVIDGLHDALMHLVIVVGLDRLKLGLVIVAGQLGIVREVNILTVNLDINRHIAMPGVFQGPGARIEASAGQDQHGRKWPRPFGFGEPGVDAPAIRPGEADLAAFDRLGFVPRGVIVSRDAPRDLDYRH